MNPSDLILLLFKFKTRHFASLKSLERESAPLKAISLSDIYRISKPKKKFYSGIFSIRLFDKFKYFKLESNY